MSRDRGRVLLPRKQQARELERIRAYLPAGWEAYARPMGPFDRNAKPSAEVYAVIRGDDSAGWTWADYVQPRLASGMIYAETIGACRCGGWCRVSYSADEGSCTGCDAPSMT